MLEDAKIIELFFARSKFAIKELDTKYGKVCYKIAFNILFQQLLPLQQPNQMALK